MSDDQESPSSSVSKTIIQRGAILLATLVPPAMGFVATGVNWLAAHPILAIIALAIYGVLVAIITFVMAVLGKLQPVWVDRTATRLDTWLRLKVSRVERDYLAYISASSRYVDLHGLTTRAEFTFSLTEVFVPLSVEPTPTTLLESGTLRSHSTPIRQSIDRSIWSWIHDSESNCSALVVIGPPGSGKTTLLKHIAFELSTTSKEFGLGKAKNRRIPFFLAFRDLREKLETSPPPALASMIKASLADVPIQVPLDWIEAKLKSGQVIVLLDGLDELATATLRSAATKWTNEQQQSFPGCVFVTTSRPFGYKSNPLRAATVVQVDEFSPRQAEKFITLWYRATAKRSYGSKDAPAELAAELAADRGARDLIRRINDSEPLRSFAANPLLLTMMASVHNYRGALPGTRAELYKEVCSVFLGARHHARGVQLSLSAAQKQAVLQKLAFEMMVASTSIIKSETAAGWINEAIDRVSPGTFPEDFLRLIEESSGILVERENGSYSFVHQTFQEYLSATYVRETGRAYTLTSRVREPYWHEVIRLYCAESDASEIVAACLDNSSDISALRLAVECLEDAREVDPAVRARLYEALSPASIRSDPLARQVAARLSMLLRLNRFRQVTLVSSIAQEPATNLEYQYFMDWDSTALLPTGWTSRVFPTQFDAGSPVFGMTMDDAQKFTHFFQRESGGPHSIGLPLVGELPNTLSNASITHIWAINDRGMAEAHAINFEESQFFISLAAQVRTDLRQYEAKLSADKITRRSGSSTLPESFEQDVQARLQDLTWWSLNSLDGNSQFKCSAKNAVSTCSSYPAQVAAVLKQWISYAQVIYFPGLPTIYHSRILRLCGIVDQFYMAGLNAAQQDDTHFLRRQVHYVYVAGARTTVSNDLLISVDVRTATLLARIALLVICAELLRIADTGALIRSTELDSMDVAEARASARADVLRLSELALSAYCRMAMAEIPEQDTIDVHIGLLVVRTPISEPRRIANSIVAEQRLTSDDTFLQNRILSYDAQSLDLVRASGQPRHRQ